MKSVAQLVRKFEKTYKTNITEDEFISIQNMISTRSKYAELIIWEPGNDIGIFKILWKDLELIVLYSYGAQKIVSFKSSIEEFEEL